MDNIKAHQRLKRLLLNYKPKWAKAIKMRSESLRNTP